MLRFIKTLWGGMMGKRIVVCPSCDIIRHEEPCPNCRYQYNPITLDAYYGGHQNDPRYQSELIPLRQTNAKRLLDIVNSLMAKIAVDLPWLGSPQVNSGWRPRAYNASIGGATTSKHVDCLAIDLHDPNNELGKYFQSHEQLLVDNGLAIEMPDYTPEWCHIQLGAPPSGNHIFIPFPKKVN